MIIPLEKTKIKAYLCAFMIFYFVIPKFTKGIMVFLSWETIFLLKKTVGACSSRPNKRVLLVVFWWRVLHHPVVNHAFPRIFACNV